MSMHIQPSSNRFLIVTILPTRASGIQFLGIRVRFEFQLSFSQGLAKFEYQTTACGQCVSLKSEVRGNWKGGVRERQAGSKGQLSPMRISGLRASPGRHCLLEKGGWQGVCRWGLLCAKE